MSTHDLAAHAHRAGEQHGKQDHLTAGELSRQALEHSHSAYVHSKAASELGNHDIAALAHELWQARGRPDGSPEEDWHQAVEQLRSRGSGR
jgi:Protein of unknown function (DUF2934)